MSRAIIVHCWDGYPNYCWYPSVKEELEKINFKVEVPAFPHTDAPTEKDWVPFLANIIGEPDEDLFLIGHSVGCITILRYLETLGEGRAVGGVVLVAGFTDDIGYSELTNYFEDPVDFEKIKSRSKGEFVAIHSDNDPYVDLKYGDILRDKLGARLIVKHNMEHFSGPIGEEASCTELPDVVEAVKLLTL